MKKDHQMPTANSLLPAPFGWVEIPMQGYQMAKYPLTNAQYQLFMEAGGYGDDQWWTLDGILARNTHGWKAPRQWLNPPFNHPDNPVVSISWYEAVAYCGWLSALTGQHISLPTETQWQYAAQGDDGRVYPWGDVWDDTRCNNNNSHGTRPVQHYEGRGDSPFGVVDMAGNVWEWCLTDFEQGTNDLHSPSLNRVLRGGSWYFDNPSSYRCAFRLNDSPTDADYTMGFRLVLLRAPNAG
jgi:formylglycine-generating enzyme required for sulfatase activity